MNKIGVSANMNIELTVYLLQSKPNSNGDKLEETKAIYKKVVHDNCKYLNAGDMIHIDNINIVISHKRLNLENGNLSIVSRFYYEDNGMDIDMAIESFEESGFVKKPV
ncbi:MAG: hypothetical protein ABUK01_04245 [Leptospirales bacterium]